MLTNVCIKALKPANRAYKKLDSGGLYIQVQPTRTKLWRLAYRFGVKQKPLSGALYSAGRLDA